MKRKQGDTQSISETTALKYKILAEKLDIKYYFAIEYGIMNAIGFDLISKEHIFKRPWVTLSTFISIITLMVGMVHFGYMHIHELDLVTDSLGPFVQSVLAMWKCTIFIYKREEIIGVVHRIWDLSMKGDQMFLAHF